MDDLEKAFKDLCVHLKVGRRPSPAVYDDYHSRDVVVTPFDGAYGRAGVVLALNGSPPRGLFFVTKNAMDSCSTGFGVVWFDGTRQTRILGEQQRQVVIRFLEGKDI